MFEMATSSATGTPPPASSAAGLGMAACDASGRLTFQSAALQELLGRSFASDDVTEPAAPGHLYALDGLTRLRPEHLPLARARHGEVVTDAMICHRSKAQVPTYLLCNAAPVTSSDGSVDGAVVFVEAVTAEDVTAEDVGRDNQPMRDRLISTLNHELRTPLTKLLGHAELLQDMRSQLPVDAVRSVEKVCQAAQELQELADLVSCMADLRTPGGLTEAHPAQIPEQLARGRLKSF